MSLKALADAVLKRDTPRDGARDAASHVREQQSGAVRRRESPDHGAVFSDVDAFLVNSRVLGESVWLAPDDAIADRLEHEPAAGGDRRLVFTVAELLPLAAMLEADRRTLLAALARIKHAMPGATLESVTLTSEVQQ